MGRPGRGAALPEAPSDLPAGTTQPVGNANSSWPGRSKATATGGLLSCCSSPSTWPTIAWRSGCYVPDDVYLESLTLVRFHPFKEVALATDSLERGLGYQLEYARIEDLILKRALHDINKSFVPVDRRIRISDPTDLVFFFVFRFATVGHSVRCMLDCIWPSSTASPSTRPSTVFLFHRRSCCPSDCPVAGWQPASPPARPVTPRSPPPHGWPNNFGSQPNNRVAQQDSTTKSEPRNARVVRNLYKFHAPAI